MELEFDKEIDALMRKGGLAVGDTPAGGHLDADEIAAFAENAMPERAKALHLEHISNCDRCRKILSNLVMIRAEAEPEEASAAVSAAAPREAEVPWYRKLFLFPNLAYVMGGLVLVLGGLIGFSVLQNSSGGGQTAVSQITETETAHGPMAPAESAATPASNTAANAAASNTNMVAAAEPSPGASVPANSSSSVLAQRGDGAVPDGNASADGVTSAGAPSLSATQPAAAPPPAPMAEAAPKDAPPAKDDEKARITEEAVKKKAAELDARKMDDVAVSNRQMQNLPRTQAGGVAKAVPGPTRDMQQTFPNRSENTYELRSRRVGGKDFQFRDGAWYDTSYRGQATTNVRRGTDEYRKLDAGLRTIAERLTGVVVTLWNGKAYRIQ